MDVKGNDVYDCVGKQMHRTQNTMSLLKLYVYCLFMGKQIPQGELVLIEIEIIDHNRLAVY